MPDPITRLRKDLLGLIDGGSAHLTFDEAVKGVTAEELGQRVPEMAEAGRAYTVWRLVEHMRIAQRDLLDYVKGAGYIEKNWPDDYWPDGDAPDEPDDEARLAAFARSCEAFREDAAAFRAMVENRGIDPLAPIEHANGTTLVRNVVLAADHNAYHLGQLVAVRKVLGTWPGA